MKSLKTALKNIRRMPYKSLVAIMMISLTFFVAYSFSMIALGTEEILQFFESQPKVIAFFDINTTNAKVLEVANEVQASPNVTVVSVETKEEALQYYREQQDNPLLLELVSADILPASIEVSSTDPDNLTKIQAQLEQYSSITDIVLYQDVVQNLNKWTQSMRLIGVSLIALLSVVSLLVIITIISLKVSHKKRSISILRIIGASSGYIITPFIYEGFLYGLLGSIFGWIGMYASYLYIQPWLKNFLETIIEFPLPWQFFALQLALGSTIALFLGGLASIIAAKKLIKK